MEFDPRLFSDLKDKDFSGSGLMALEGRILIEKALECGIEMLGLVRSEDSGEDWLEAYAGKFPITTLDHAALCAIAGFKFHHGAIAMARRPELWPASSLAAGVGAWLCLWNVTDPSNVGALIRSAAGLGATGILLGTGCADPYYRKALRASMGNAFSLPLYACDEAALRALAGRGFNLAAATLSPKALPLGAFTPRRPFVLVVGNEGFGLPSGIVDICRDEVYIPMSPGIDSLNVVVAGGICMYELFGNRAGGLTRP
ncbi:MAG: RNA methyltransferase [Rectinemataceae bacterium]|nr:RNA methyltransferase [Rectinemataceae bacterium]